MVFKKLPDKKDMVRYSRMATVFTLGAALMMTIFSKDITGYITSMVSTLLSGLAVSAVAGRYWKRATWQGGIAALIGGSAVSIIVSNSEKLMGIFANPILLSLAGALVSLIVVSLLTPANAVSEEQALEKVMRGRNT